MDMAGIKHKTYSYACCMHTGPAHHVLCRTHTRSYSSEVDEYCRSTSGVRLCCRHWGGTEVRSICVFVVAIVSVPDSCTWRRFTVRRPEMNVYVILHAPDLWYGRQIDIHNVVQHHIAPRVRLRLVWGSLTLA